MFSQVKSAAMSSTRRVLKKSTTRFQTPREAKQLAQDVGDLFGDKRVELALTELLTNAIEHGNLGIGYELKSSLLLRGGYELEVQRRLTLPENQQKFATLVILSDGDQWRILITDCGEGFDFARYQCFDEQRILHSHGRGVLMANSLVTMEYLPPGNCVRLKLDAPRTRMARRVTREVLEATDA